jgi:hypothetical protein
MCDYGTLACAVFVQHKNFYGIAQVAVVKLTIANAMKSYGCIRRDHEIQSGARWPAIKKRCWKTTGRNPLIANVMRTKPQVACGSRLSKARTSSADKSLIIRV